MRCVAVGVGSGAIAFELVYDDQELDNNRSAGNRSAVLLALIQALRGARVEDGARVRHRRPPLAPF